MSELLAQGLREMNPVEPDWHGWSKTIGVHRAASLHIGHLPGRKSLCLYEVDGSTLNVLAYFRDQDSAQRAMKLIDILAGL